MEEEGGGFLGHCNVLQKRYISFFPFFLFVSFSTAVVSDSALKILKIQGGAPPFAPPPEQAPA